MEIIRVKRSIFFFSWVTLFNNFLVMVIIMLEFLAVHGYFQFRREIRSMRKEIRRVSFGINGKGFYESK